MNSRQRIIAGLILCLASVLSAPAHAATIDYIWSGTFDGSLGSFATFSNANFTIDLSSDIGTTFLSGGEFFNPAISGTFSAGAFFGTLTTSFLASNETVINPAVNTIVFGQSQVSPAAFFAEGITDPSLGAYNLQTSFPLIGGAVSQTADSSFKTNLGNLVFGNITSITFQAVTPAPTPLPDALPLFAAALIAMGIVAWDKKRKAARTDAK